MKKNEKEAQKLEILRTKLALSQTAMACQRSLLSYIRTACVFVSLAFTYLKVASDNNFDPFVVVMFVIGTAFLIFGLVEYHILMKKQRKLTHHLTEKYIEEHMIDDEDF